MGAEETGLAGSVEAALKYHPDSVLALTGDRDPAPGPCQVGSLTGAVASQRVTEAPKGSLRQNGNLPKSVKA